MKTLVKIFFLAALTGLLSGCDKTGEFIENETPELKKAQMEITVPFKADFIGTYLEGIIPCAECGPWNIPGGEAWGLIQNEGGGNSTQLGKFIHYFEFCANLITGEYPGNHMKAWFVAANGDSLFIACGGQVLEGKLVHHPEDVNSYFKDPFVILGGTGRFEGATGSGWTDDYNRDSYPENSFHHWTGTITLVKGKK
jgi:hypothetical protein